MDLGDGRWRAATEVTPEKPEEFPLRRVAHLRAPGHELPMGTHEIEIAIEVQGVGALSFKVKDHVAEPQARPTSVPYSKEDNYTPEIIAERQRFIEQVSGVKLQHVGKYSFDPQVDQGQHRELHRRGPGSARLRRAAAR